MSAAPPPANAATRMDGWTVVVTPGASEFGLALGRRLGQAGAHVVLADHDPDFAAAQAAKLHAEGLSASFAQLDGRDPAQCRALVERVVAECGTLHGWVNGEAVAAIGAAETLAPTAWEESLVSILSAAFYGAQAAGAQMLKQGRGVIVNVASVDAYQAQAGRAAASAAAAGLVALTRALGVEWAGRGVRVVGVAAGPPPDADQAAHARRTPLRRLATPADLAEAAFFLASDEAAFIVGETLRVDGGWTAYHLF